MCPYSVTNPVHSGGSIEVSLEKKQCKKPILELECDEFVRSAVQRKIHQFHGNIEPSTVGRI